MMMTSTNNYILVNRMEKIAMFQQMTRKIAPYLAALGLVWLLAACGGQPTPDYATVAPSSFTPGSSIPGPEEEPVLTIFGDITIENTTDGLVLDLATLEELGLVEYSVIDPWLKAEVTYTGVLVSELLKYTGAQESATNIRLVALDDYEVNISIADVKKWPVLLATRTDGKYMDVENSGPTRIIFPYNSYPEIDHVAYKDLWIWNLKSMELQ